MPNWKSYEASVRLLSAIIAAHPGLKLNYDEIGRFYGGGTKYKSVWDRMTQLTRYADALTAAVESGNDPINVELAEGTAQGSKPRAKDISKRFGGDCTKSALENRFRRIKSDAKLINDAVAQGIDVIKINVGDTEGAAAMGGSKAIQRNFGSDTTAQGISTAITRYWKPKADLIIATVAAGSDPLDLQLMDVQLSRAGGNGKDVARCFGDGVKGGSLKAQMNRHVGRNVKLINDALERGDDPGQVTLGGLFGKYDNKEGNEIAKCMGKDVTAKALEWQMWNKFKKVAKLQLAAIAAGQDPQFVDFEATAQGAKGNKDVARVMGSDVTANGLRFQFTDKFKPIGKLQLDALKAGLDPKDVDTSVTAKSCKDIAKYMGSDVTKGSIEWQFRRFKIGGKLQRQAVKNGVDPLTVNVDVNVKGGAEAKLKQQDSHMARALNDDTTASALEHRFRPIKKDAAVMAAAIAGSYQQGITDGGASATPTPAKKTPQKRGPNKNTPKTKAMVMENGNGGSDDEEGSDFATPSKKKGALNKVKGGRVTKPKSKNQGFSQSFSHEEDEDEDEAEDNVKPRIKPEPSMYSNGNGHGHGNGFYSGGSMANAASFSFDQDEAPYYDPDEDDQI